MLSPASSMTLGSAQPASNGVGVLTLVVVPQPALSSSAAQKEAALNNRPNIPLIRCTPTRRRSMTDDATRRQERDNLRDRGGFQGKKAEYRGVEPTD
jgi:hypothetical protein